MNLRLGFHYHIPAAQSAEGMVRLPSFLGRFVECLALRCSELVCFLHQLEEEGNSGSDYVVRAANVRLIKLPPKGSVPHRLLHARSMVKPVWGAACDLDAMLIRGPSPLLSHVARASGATPICLLLVGDYLAGVDSLPQPQWRKELIRVWSWLNKKGQDKIARKSLVIANNRLLFDEYAEKSAMAAQVWTTTLYGGDIVTRDLKAFGPWVRALYTGRMDTAKGLDDVVEALGMLGDGGLELGLDLVGWEEPGDTVLERITERGQELGVRVTYHGLKVVGPELFAYYDRADVFVMASRGSEGFPRAIFEALARGVPVVASRVGDIPNRLDDGETALLIEPNSPGNLAMAIKRLIDNDGLRRRLVENGRRLVARATLETSTDQMIRHIHDFVRRSAASRVS